MKLGLTEEQKAERLKYITATDAPIVCGVSPWGNIVDLWKYKTGLAVQEDISDKPAVRAGLYLEEPIAQWFSNDTGKDVETDETLAVHKSIPYIAAHTDRIILNESAILECKTSSTDKGWGEYGENKIPDHYLIQVAHEAMCFDVEKVYIAVLIRGSDFRHYVYERNPKLEEMIIKHCIKFWECVTKEEAPEPTNNAEAMSLYGMSTNNTPIEADDKIATELDNLKEIKSNIKELEQKQLDCETKLKLYMGEHDTLTAPDGKILATWRMPKASSRFDVKRFKDEQIELYEQYIQKIKCSRRFNVK